MLINFYFWLVGKKGEGLPNAICFAHISAHVNSVTFLRDKGVTFLYDVNSVIFLMDDGVN